jgi:hypothetical protein
MHATAIHETTIHPAAIPDTTTFYLNREVYTFILQEYVEAGELVTLTDLQIAFDLPKSTATQVLRKLQADGNIIWDHYGIRPAVAEALV